MQVMQACFYKSVTSGLFFKSLVAKSIVKFTAKKFLLKSENKQNIITLLDDNCGYANLKNIPVITNL